MRILVVVALILSTAFAQKQKEPQNVEELFERLQNEQRQMHQRLLNGFFNDDFFKRDSDPFDEIKKMRELMRKRFSDADNGFDGWYKDRMGGGDITDITQAEDDKSITYKIKVDNIKDKKVDIEVENGTISITGKTDIESKNESDKGISHSIVQSSFARTIPLPDNVDEKKAEISIDGNVISVKLPKTKSVKKIAIDKGLVI